MARRAVATEDQKKRKQAILVAARDLFNAGDGTLPAASEIAAAADLAKGTVYIYFRTKEEIFLALLLQECIDVLDRIELVFRSTQGVRQCL
jgi:AcrR family transcriptional regulator